MAVNRDFVGREYPSRAPYVVSRSAIRDFALAVGEASPLSLDPEAARQAGYADVVAPPTYLAAVGSRVEADSPIADPALGLDYSRVVHGEQRFVLHRPVVAGDELSLTTRVAEIRDVGANELISLDTDVLDAAGELVAAYSTTMISRGTAAGPGSA